MKIEPVPAPVAETQAQRVAFALAGLFACLCLWLNPIGYVGAGADDEHYLAAARCWVEAGAPCLPADHWWARWPVIAPAAAALAILGDSREALAVGASLSWGLLLFAIAALGTRWFGWRAGVVALALMAATPVVTAFALTPNPNVTELAFQLCALTAATIAYRDGSRRWAVAGGVLAGLALATRNTSILFLGASALAWLFLDPRRRRPLCWAIAGLALVTLGEMALYAATTGDPLYRHLLALSHTGLPSAELPADFDTSQSPLFNPAYIAAWRREAGIEFFWPIDGWLNLLLGPRLGPLLIAAALGSLLLHRSLAPALRRRLARAALGTALVVILLTWGLAIDPKARMFLGLGALAALALGALVAARPDGRIAPLALGLALLPVVTGTVTLSAYPNSRDAEAAATRWIAAGAGEIEIHPSARSYLAFLPEARALPLQGAGRDKLIALTAGPCEAAIVEDAEIGPTGTVLASAGQGSASASRLCLFAYADGYWQRFPERLGAHDRETAGGL